MKNRMNFTCLLLFLGISLFIVPSLKSQTYTELWGMTQYGGDNGLGCIFKTDGSGNNQSEVYSFGENPMRNPQYTHLCQASNGKLYGMTSNGGSSNWGVLFEYDPATSTYTKKLDFTGTTNGSSPLGSFMQAANGKLYGMTQQGGSSGMGVLFEYDPATSTYTKKLDFSAANGSYPKGSLMQASNGKLYGMTYQGGSSNMGVLFEYDPATSTYTKKIDFTGTSNGSYPYGSLMQAANGKLYGMTRSGGSSGYGVLFEYDPANSTYTKKLDFTGTTNGSRPYGSLMQAANGKLYGMTQEGGSNGVGVVFEYDPASFTYTKKLDFDGNNGKNPSYTHLIEICAAPEILVQPLNASLCPSNDTMFAVNAVGNNLSYHWQVNDGSGFTNILDNGIYFGASNDTIHLTGVLANMNGYTYRCEITSDCPAMSIYSDTVLLTVHPTYAFTENHSICDNESYTWHGTTYTAAGTYTASYNTVNGCDSVYTLNLSVNPTYAFTENHSICDNESYTWHGTTYTAAGTYTASYNTVNGCDSVYTLNLSVNPTYAFTENHSICDNESYTWHGNDYSSAGTYHDSLLSIHGCDSVFVLELTVHLLPTVSILSNDTFFCIDDLSVMLNGDPAGGIWSGAGISGSSFDPATAGIGLWPIVYSYPDGNGCVNADTIDVTVDACAGLSESDASGIDVFPNPTSGQLNIAFPNEDEYTLSLIDALGQIVQNKVIAGHKMVQIDLSSVVPGVYMLKIENATGTVLKRVVIEN